jgi:hypothetical protein
LQINVFLRFSWLLFLIGPAVVLAEQQAAPFSTQYSQPLQDDFERGEYRWRPLKKREEQVTTSPGIDWGRSATPLAPQYRDYADTPSGLPRGVYRPVPKRHQITPHHQGYRFRPLSPAEQERIKKRNIANRESNQPPRELVFRPYRRTTGRRSYSLSAQGQYRFRPDKRLEESPSRIVPLYSLEPGFKSY